jgi:hypothetical protein
MADTTKKFSYRDADQTLQASFNDVDSTLTVNGFLVSKVGRRVDLSITTTNVIGDTENYAFSETQPNATLSPLYTLTIVYTDATRQTLLYAVRSA